MNFEQLLAAARHDLGDTTGTVDTDFALTRADGLRFFNEAIHEACRRARLITDRSTPAICRIAVTAGQRLVPVDPRIIKIRQVSLSSRTTPLRRRYVVDMDEQAPGWETRDGSVDSYVADYETGRIFLPGTLTQDDTLKLSVFRLPLADLLQNSDIPEINPRFHAGLVPYVVHRVRSIDDSELYDPAKAAKAEKQFEAEFGPKRSAQSEIYEDSQPYEESE